LAHDALEIKQGTQTNLGQETTMTVAVVGATGNTGRAVVKELRALGHNPVCVVRNADKAREVLGADAKTAIAELTDRTALEKALAGAESVFVVTGHNPGMVEQQNNILDAALGAGAKYLVRVGGGRAVARADSESVVGRGHAAIEERLASSGIGWVILRPGLFMQNVLGASAMIKDEGKLAVAYACAKDQPVALIDVRDTGAIGARILIDPAPHVGKTYEFTGAPTTYDEFADVFSQVLGRKIVYVEKNLEQSEQILRSRQMPDWLIAHVLMLGKVGAQGAFSVADTNPIENIVGRAPITTKQFVEDFKPAFV
jgi:NAD(P)H dehydrogenase (quinone)